MNNPFTSSANTNTYRMPGDVPRWEQFALRRASRKILALPLGSAALALPGSYSCIRATVSEGLDSRQVNLIEELESGYALRKTAITVSWSESDGGPHSLPYLVAQQHEAVSMQPDAEPLVYRAGSPPSLNTLGFRPIFAAIAQVRRLEPLPEQI